MVEDVAPPTHRSTADGGSVSREPTPRPRYYRSPWRIAVVYHK